MDKEEKEKMIFLFKSASNLLDSVEDSKKNLDMLIENYNLQNSNLNKSIKELNNSVVNIPWQPNAGNPNALLDQLGNE